MGLMGNLLDYDQLFDALAGYQVTVKPATSEITIKGGDRLPVQTRLTMRADPLLRQCVIWYVCILATGKQLRAIEDYGEGPFTAVVPERPKKKTEEESESAGQ
jgi:hypothetical protein